MLISCIFHNKLCLYHVPGRLQDFFLWYTQSFFVLFVFLGGGGVCNGKVIIFSFVIYKVNSEKHLEHVLFVKCKFFVFFK